MSIGRRFFVIPTQEESSGISLRFLLRRNDKAQYEIPLARPAQPHPHRLSTRPVCSNGSVGRAAADRQLLSRF